MHLNVKPPDKNVCMNDDDEVLMACAMVYM